jgi:hypothetical protein
LRPNSSSTPKGPNTPLNKMRLAMASLLLAAHPPAQPSPIVHGPVKRR